MDNNKKIAITAEGRQKLVDELAWREGEHDAEIVERVKEARGFGDLSENAEFDAAKEEQAQNAARINEIRQILARAEVVGADTARRDLKVSIGTTVELKDEKGDLTSFTIVGTTETNSLEHKISNESPVGSALLGHKKGDEIEVVSPSGRSRSYTIVSIKR